MRVIALDRDLIVFVSRIWQTTCSALRWSGEAFLVDSPVLPDELEALPSVLEQSDFAVSALLVTHADWDHLLARYAFPGSSLGCPESSARRIAAEPGAAQRELRQFDEQHYLERQGTLGLGGIQPLPVPGKLELGDAAHELELHPAEGHTGDGAAYWVPWLKVLICGDYLSPVEIPSISDGGSLEGYLATLERLAPLVEQARAVVPGHGAPLEPAGALRIIAEDLAYVNSLAADAAGARAPASRASSAQRRIHEANLARIRA